jgi:hypothetical protein
VFHVVVVVVVVADDDVRPFSSGQVNLFDPPARSAEPKGLPGRYKNANSMLPRAAALLESVS